MAEGEFDPEVLQTGLRRREILQALSEKPHHRQELQDRFDISKTTCHRIIRSLEEFKLLERTDTGYELSTLGEVICSQVASFDRNVRTAYALRPLLEAFDSADTDFDIGLLSEVTVTRPQPDDPSPPINRYLELFREAETIRTIDRTSFIPPLYVEEILETGIEVGGAGIAIYPKSVVETRFAEYPEIHQRIFDQGLQVRYRIHDDIPFGMTIYDDTHVGFRAYDDETGNLLLFADTGDPDAVEWAVEIFNRYYAQSTPAGECEELPDWVPASEITL